jgi:cell division septal protein FtsQ
MKPRATTPRNQRNSNRKQRKQQHILDVKVRSRAANRHRNRRLLTWISSIVLLGAAGYGAFAGGRYLLRRFLWENPDYNLAQIEYHTDGPLTRDQALAASGIHEGRNIFTISLSQARKGLMALPQVAHAELERTLPNKISIDVTERMPVAWVTAHENADPSADPGALLIDHDGTLIDLKSRKVEYCHLPVITGVNVENYEAGQTVDLPEVRAAIELIRLTGENPARYQVRSIDVSKGYCLAVKDERHATNLFPLENLAAQLDRLAVVYAHADACHEEIQTVNLLVQRNIPVTFATPPPGDGADAGGDAAQPSPSPTPTPTVRRAQAVHKGATHHTHLSDPTVRRAIPLTPFSSQQ